MQMAKKVKNDFSTNVIKLKLTTIETKGGDETFKNNENIKKTCFRSDERYFCKDTECACASECKKLVAAWMR